MFKFIISSIFIFIIICLLILLLISTTTTITTDKKNKEHFTNNEPMLNIELVKYPPNQISNVSGVNRLNNYYFQTFDSTNGRYTIVYSTIWSAGYNLHLLFNTDTNITNGGAHFQTGGYDTNTGEHNGGIRCPFVSDAKMGDWIIVILPKQTKLKKYGFAARATIIGRAPGKWDLYAANTSSNMNNISTSRFTIIDTNQERLNDTSYSRNSNLTYTKNIYSNEGLYDTYLFIFNSAASSNINTSANYMINFQQLYLLGSA